MYPKSVNAMAGTKTTGLKAQDVEIPAWMNDKPERRYSLIMAGEGCTAVDNQYMQLTQAEFIELKQRLAIVRGYVN